MNANCTSALKWFTKKKTELKKFKEKIYSLEHSISYGLSNTCDTTQHS